MINIQELNKQLDGLNYWDSEMLDFHIKYFGDEATLYIQKYDSRGCETDYCWKLTFFRCYKVYYETNAGLKASQMQSDGTLKEIIARTWNRSEDIGIGSSLSVDYLQHMEVEQYNDFLYKFDITLSMMTIYIVCQDVTIEEVLIKEQGFFWDKVAKKTSKNIFKRFLDN